MKKNYLLPILLMLTRLCFGQNVSIGDILCTDGSTVRPEQFASSGKTADGVVFFVDSDSQQGWAVSLECQAINTHWVTQTHYEDWYDIPMLENFEYSREAIYDLDGYNNTDIIRSTHGADWYPAAWSVDFDHGWYLPAAGQLRWLIAYINEINASLAAVNGEMFVYDHPRWYWSSTERTGAHAVVISQTGSVGNYPKWNYIGEYEIGVRAVKNFTIQDTSYHIGDVVTTPNGQRGVVFYISPEDGSYWLVALNDLPRIYNWGPETDIARLNNYNAYDQFVTLHGVFCGYDATLYMKEAMGTSPQYASSNVDLDNGWHIPSAGQLSKLYAALPFIENILIRNGGSTLSGNYYWASTECSRENAWAINFGDNPYTEGILKDFTKTSSFPVRPVWSEPCCVIEAEHYGEGCETYTYHGVTYSESGDYEYLIENPMGCDTLLTIHVQLGDTIHSIQHISDCKPYTWNGITYDESGVYQQTFSSALGCDSIVTLYLNVGEQIMNSFAVNTCDSYTWNETTYTESGLYEQTFTSAQGCDSIVLLDLTIKNSAHVSQIHGENLIYYQTSGEYAYSIDPVPGCFGYEWSIDGPWRLQCSSDSPECTLNINSPGNGTLKVRVYNECGFVERTLFINHDARPDIVIYPNPTKGEFNIVLYGMQGEAAIVIYDYLGQFIGRFSVNTDLEGTTIPYSLAGKAAGVYLINVINRFEKVTKKVVKETPSSYGIYNWEW